MAPHHARRGEPFELAHKHRIAARKALRGSPEFD